MPDRMDIDALLIGALYGELTPADEALLTAHLESHPADRTALADLTRTRAAVRDSRLLAVQLEPPQAISALLLQEASRRAPRSGARDARDRETASWFQRFVRSFMVHPAMAAAAMLVLVIGVAGTFYLRGTNQFAESAPPELQQSLPARNAAQAKVETTTVSPQGVAPAAPAPEPEAPQTGDRAAAGSAVGAGAGGYRVDLDDVAKNQPAPAKQADLSVAAGGKKAKEGQKAVNPFADEAQAPEAPKHAARPPADPAARPPADTRDTRADKPTKSDKKIAGIVVRTPELSPRELKDSDDETFDRSRRKGFRGDGASATGRVTRGAGADAPGGGGVPPAPAAATPAPMTGAPDQAGPEAAPALEPGAVAKQAPPSTPKIAAKTDAKKPAMAKPAPVRTMPPQSAAAVAPPPPPANDANGERNNRIAGKPAGPAAKDATSADKPLVDKSLIDWARKRHEQVKTLVSSNNCRAAANAATEIYSRAPDYYAANVVTDRTIKPCLAYLNNEREREDRVRAAKNAAASDSAAPVPPPVRK